MSHKSSTLAYSSHLPIFTTYLFSPPAYAHHLPILTTYLSSYIINSTI